MSASVPAISCRCMHALTYSIYLDCHTSPQSSYLVCCTYLVSACMSSLLHLFQCTFLPSYSPPYVYSLCVVYSLHCLISLPVSCWSLPIACLLYMPIQFATPKQSSKPPIYAPIDFYPQVASISNIRSILSNRAYSMKIVVPQNLVLFSFKLR